MKYYALAPILLSVLMLAQSGCTNACLFAFDGVCDEPTICPLGTDSSDCRDTGCTDTCAYAFDGACDDGGPGSVYSLCTLGTDCSDCGPR